jgi:hypothetical protein
MLMLDPLATKGGEFFAPSGLETFLEKCGVKLHNDIVTLWVKLLGTPARVNPAPASASECEHRIVNGLRDGGSAVSFDAPRSMEFADPGPDKPGLHPTALIKTSAKFWGETDLQSYRKGTNEQDDKDHTGRLVVAAAVHDGPSATPGAEEDVTPRLVVFGDSDFIGERDLSTGGNLDLFLNSLYWLSRSVGRQKMIGISPKEPERVKFNITREKLNAVVWPIVVGLPVLVLFLGIGVWWSRRS